MLPTRIKRRRKGYLEPSDSRWLATLYMHTKPYYAYDALGCPTERQTNYPQKGQQQAASFCYNDRSELTSATLDATPYAYTYDNIGNRITAQESAEEITYTANELNQYTQIDTDGSEFEPKYDEDGNQTQVRTSTGIWHVTYNAQNRAIRYESEDGTTIITCGYDYMGRRFEKKVEVNGEIALHEGYIYHGYLQIACVDLQKPFQAAVRYITWDPSQPTATRPLALQQNSVWYTYGWDLTKNICELYNNTGYILNLYTYTPYGLVTANSEVDQPIQWSSEMYDAELGLVYYNYRYYNPTDGRWTRRDPNGFKSGMNLYSYTDNSVSYKMDYLGLVGSPKEHKTKTLVEGVLECTCGTKSTASLSWWVRLQLILDYIATGFSLELSSEIPCDLSGTKDGPGGEKGRMKMTYRFDLEWEEWEESREELIPNPVTGGFDLKTVTPTYREDMHIVPYMTMIEDTSYLCCKKYH